MKTQSQIHQKAGAVAPYPGPVRGWLANPQRGFTHVELLALLAAVSTLASILVPLGGGTLTTIRRTACLNNQRQLALAALQYAEDDKQRSLSGQVNVADHSVAWLQPYVSPLGSFVCPDTRNRLRPEFAFNAQTGEPGLRDLETFAHDRKAAFGTSYLNHGMFGSNVGLRMTVDRGIFGSTTLPYLRKTLDNIQAYTKRNAPEQGRPVTPAEFWLFADNYWEGPLEGYPDALSNHGAAGINVSYCDGHAAWLPTSAFLEAYERDTDEGRTGVDLSRQRFGWR